ncbi:hypothetical protein C6Q13_11200 [Burkholderia gladioli]|nr:hypothetical protein CO712_00605 [Burkholderia gladioli pv. gladioli]PEH86365.1 hypothetical protein CRM95_16210 [Burkholderia gladioli]PRE88310.1 hypothetical protein C6Q13_11200 [Burkholderia gladioli]
MSGKRTMNRSLRAAQTGVAELIDRTMAEEIADAFVVRQRLPPHLASSARAHARRWFDMQAAPFAGGGAITVAMLWRSLERIFIVS